MKFVNTRPLADPDVASRNVELANAVEPYFDNRILIEKINGPFLYELRGHAGGVQGWPRSRDRERLAGSARERYFSTLHPGGCGPVRLKPDSQFPWSRPILGL
jgi:hypothetical protein